MKPLIYSERVALTKGMGWSREGEDICYYTNNMKRKLGGYYSSLSFTLKFECIQIAIKMTTITYISRIAIHTPILDFRNISNSCKLIQSKNIGFRESFYASLNQVTSKLVIK